MNYATNSASHGPTSNGNDRLDSWKEIAAYLKRDLRTVQRWEEKEGLPVHRHLHSRQGSVYAYKTELDAWWTKRRPKDQATKDQSTSSVVDTSAATAPGRKIGRIYTVGVVILILLSIGGVVLWRTARRRTWWTAQRMTLAVLPFEVLSDSPDDAYLADGLTDDLITDLGRTGQIEVISRTSVMQFKGKHQPLIQTAQALNARLIVEGAIAHSGERLRITVQLIDAANDRHVWADSYERDYKNVLSLQDDIAGDITAAMTEKLRGAAAILVPARPVNPDARSSYLLGRYYWSNRNEGGLKQAIRYFQKAISKDSDYAAAYAGLADCYNLLSVWGSMTPSESFPEAARDARIAIQLDPNSPEAYTSLAFETYRYGWDFTQAEKEFQKAITLNPNYSTAHQWYGEFLGDITRFDQGIGELHKAEQLDPLSSIVSSDLAAALVHAGRTQEAIDVLKHALAMHPDFVPAHLYLADTYELLGRSAEAEQERLIYVRLSGDSGQLVKLQISKDWAAGRRDLAQREIEKLATDAKEGRFGYFQLAQIYERAGERDEAYACLEKAYQEHSWWLVTLEVDTVFAPLRHDPEFSDLVHRVGLPN